MPNANEQHACESDARVARWWDIAALACGAGVVVWLWLVWQQALINKDGVRYVASAEAVLQGNWAQAWHAFPWPFHSVLMAGLHRITGVHLETAGHLLNLTFYLIVIVSSLAILRQFGASRRIMAFGAALVLLHPDLNATLPSIYRDQGYWAFFLVAVLCFLLFWRTGWWRYALGCTFAMFIATAFRIEGLIMLAALAPLPLLDARHSWSQRTRRLGKFLTLPLLVGVIGLTGGLVDASGSETLAESRIQEPIERAERIWRQWTAGLPRQSQRLSDAVLNRHSERHAFGALLAAYGYVAVASTLRGVNWLYLAIGVVGVVLARNRIDRPMRLILLWLIFVNTVMLGIFMLQEHFVSHRYAMGLAFLVMLFAAFGMSMLRDLAHSSGVTGFRRAAFPIAMVLWVIVGLDGLIRTGAQNVQEREAGIWMAEHVPEGAPLYIQNLRVRYYAARTYLHERDQSWEEVQDAIAGSRWREYEYIALDIGHRSDDQLQWVRTELGCEPRIVFENRRGSRVVIFQTADCEPDAHSD